MTRGRDAAAFERCIAAGGVAVFAADTVYGLACDPDDAAAVARLYELKGRPPAKPSAVMVFDAATLPPAGERTRAALARLLPGPVTVLLPNPGRRYPLACAQDPGTLGLRWPVVPPLAGVSVAVLQSSANLAGGPDARRLAEVPASIRAGADLVLDGGELPGLASTVIDLRRYEDGGEWRIVREGALARAQVTAALAGQFHFDPTTYDEMIHADIPVYDELQAQLAAASGEGAQRILELGTGTGQTTRRLLERHPSAVVVGIDGSAPMLDAARAALPPARVTLVVGAIEGPLPAGPFDLVASALCVHHLDGAGKRDLFARVGAALAPGGRFVLADVVVPVDPADAVTELTPGFDRPSTLGDQLRWLGEAGFASASVAWALRDLAVIVADTPLPSDA